MLACYGSDRPAMALVSAWMPVEEWIGGVWGGFSLKEEGGGYWGCNQSVGPTLGKQ